MTERAIHKCDLSKIEALCMPDGKLIPVPASFLKTYSNNTLWYFCYVHGYYTLPTTEMIEWLRKEIGEMSAIEVAAGNGCIGRALGIPIIDNCMQDRPDIKTHYRNSGQPTIKYPADIIKMDGELAVVTYRPDVIVASYLTSKWEPGMDEGNMYAPDERTFTAAKKYIHIGNENIHGKKPLLKLCPVKRYKFPWHFGRGEKKDNVIYVFDMTKFRDYEGK